MTVPFQNIVKIKNAKILVLKSFVVLEQAVKLKLIELFVNVLVACKVTHWFLALKLDVPQALSVLMMKNVITLHHPLQEENVSHYVERIHALPALLARQIITEKAVLVTIPFKETDIYLVQNVSKLKIVQ